MVKALGVLPLVERSRLCSAAGTVLAKEGGFPGSNNQRRWESNAATSVSSDVPRSPRGRGRISKEERHALVESYIDEYRKRNNGKFPTVKDAMKHVGGGYYAVRKIVQELEYASKSPHMTSRTIISAETEQSNGKKSLTDVRKFLQTGTGDSHEEQVAQKLTKEHLKRVKEDVKDAPISRVKLECHKEEEDYFLGTDPNKSPVKEAESEVFSKKPEESATLETKDYPSQLSLDPEFPARKKEDYESPGEASFWGSLKTFADGIFGIWRRK